MKTYFSITLAMLAGFGLGAIAVQGLHAQAKVPIYTVTEIDVTNLPDYVNDYAPRVQATIKASGGRILAASQNVTSLEGAPPKNRVTIQVWDNMGQVQAWRASPEYKEARKLGDSYAKFRSFAIEGVP
jgi:uncharacterized protein (DUF1330 family)